MEICRRQFGACLLGGLAGRLVAANRPKVLVFLLLEQFRPDYLEAVSGQLSLGGFRRIMERGAWFPDCRHLASTFSSTAVATLATGAWPAEHGIVADSWYDRAARRRVTANDELLLATTLAAQVPADAPIRVSVIATDPGHARLFAGAGDAHLYWMDEEGRFATREEAPDWLAAFNTEHEPDAMHDRPWMAVGARPDAPPLRRLTFDAAHPEQFIALYKASPFAADAEFDLLQEVIARELPGVVGTHFVCLIDSTMARLGYDVGGRSQLMPQMALQLDRRIESLLGLLAKSAGETAYTLALVGGHGAPPEPVGEARARMAVDGEKLARGVNDKLSASASGAVEKYLYPFLYLKTVGYRDPEPLRQAAGRAALEQAAVAAFFTAEGASSTHDDWEQRFRNSFHSQRSGDLMLSYRPEYIEDFGQGRGVSYGSLYNYDVRVPLGLFGAGIRPGVCERTVESVDLTATLARILGLSMPSSSVGRVLAEGLA